MFQELGYLLQSASCVHNNYANIVRGHNFSMQSDNIIAWQNFGSKVSA